MRDDVIIHSFIYSKVSMHDTVDPTYIYTFINYAVPSRYNNLSASKKVSYLFYARQR